MVWRAVAIGLALPMSPTRLPTAVTYGEKYLKLVNKPN